MIDHRLSAALTVVITALAILGCNSNSAAPAAPANTPISVAASSPSASATASTPDDCQNTAYPVVRGATWTYAMSGPLKARFKRTITTVTATGFTEKTTYSTGAASTSQWQCDDGALMDVFPDTPSTARLHTTSGATAVFRTTETDGITLPAQIVPGATWNQNLTLEGTEKIADQDVPAQNVVTVNCTGIATEWVTVPAGRFQAMRSECATDEKVTVTVNGAAVPTDIASTSTVWYAPGVGMVRTVDVISGSTTVTIELTSYKIP